MKSFSMDCSVFVTGNVCVHPHFSPSSWGLVWSYLARQSIRLGIGLCNIKQLDLRIKALFSSISNRGCKWIRRPTEHCVAGVSPCRVFGTITLDIEWNRRGTHNICTDSAEMPWFIERIRFIPGVVLGKTRTLANVKTNATTWDFTWFLYIGVVQVKLKRFSGWLLSLKSSWNDFPEL